MVCPFLGIGMYAAWASVATLLNTGIALVHTEPHLKQTTASSLVLGKYPPDSELQVKGNLRYPNFFFTNEGK